MIKNGLEATALTGGARFTEGRKGDWHGASDDGHTTGTFGSRHIELDLLNVRRLH